VVCRHQHTLHPKSASVALPPWLCPA
jgi:hypothetical protein